MSTSREHVALTPCDESVSSLLYGGNGAESEMASERKTPSEISESIKPRQQPAKMSFGGIMISQEVTVNVEEATELPPDVIELPPAAHHRDSGNGAPGLTRQRSQRALQNMGNGTDQNPAKYDQAIELKEVSTALGMGLSRVEVVKEGDDTITTFVDDLFSVCIDTPRRM